MMCAVQLILVINVPSDCLMSFLNVCQVQAKGQMDSGMERDSAVEENSTRSTNTGQAGCDGFGAIPQLLPHPSGRARRHAPCSPDQPESAALPIAAGTSAATKHSGHGRTCEVKRGYSAALRRPTSSSFGFGG